MMGEFLTCLKELFFNKVVLNKILVLDHEFRKEFEKIIEGYLLVDIDPKFLPRLHKIWKIEHSEFEFLYGSAVGFLTGIATGMLIEKYKRNLFEDENNEIFEIIESYANKIRDQLNKYKT